MKQIIFAPFLSCLFVASAAKAARLAPVRTEFLERCTTFDRAGSRSAFPDHVAQMRSLEETLKSVPLQSPLERAQAAMLAGAIEARVHAFSGPGLDDGPIGESEYRYRLSRQLGIDMAPTELREEAFRAASGIRERMITIASGLAPRQTLDQVMADFAKDIPRNDAAALAAYEAQVERARHFTRDSGIFPAASKKELTIREYSGGVSAAYVPQQHALLIGLRRDESAFLQSHKHAVIPAIATHEGIPGHGLYFPALPAFEEGNRMMHATLNALSFSAQMAVEGYACYVEELLRQRGYFSPREELALLGLQLSRAWDMILDVGIQMNELGVAQAQRELEQNAFVPEREAARRVANSVRAPLWPAPYFLGWRQLEELKAEIKAKAGTSFSEKRFHEAIFQMGFMPPILMKESILAIFGRTF